MLWLGVLLVVGAMGCIVYIVRRTDKKLKAKFEDKFDPANWDLPRSVELDPELRPKPVIPPAAKVTLHYQKKPSLFSDSQRLIFNALQQSISSDHILLSSINVADVLSVNPNGNVLAMQVATQNMVARQFDVVICTKNELAPVCAVVIGNSLEPLLVNACESAHLPLVCLKAQANYDVAWIRARLVEAMENQTNAAVSSASFAAQSAVHTVNFPLGTEQKNIAERKDHIERKDYLEQKNSVGKETVVEVSASVELPASPASHVKRTNSAIQAELCPYCSSVMLKRKAKNGASAGQLFWICSDYPKCRGMVPVK